MEGSAPSEGLQDLGPGARYPRVLQALHWGIAGLISLQFAIILVLKQLQALSFGQLVLSLHRQCGALILVLVLARLALAIRFRVPKSPFRFPPWQVAAAHATHAALMATLIAQPVLGALTAWARGDEVKLFFVLTIPKLVTLSNAQGVALGAWHGRIAIAMLALVGLHVGAVVFNRVARKAAVIERMMPPVSHTRLINRVPILAQLAICCSLILALTLGAGLYGAAQYRSFNQLRGKFDETEVAALDDMRAAQLSVKALATQASDGQPGAVLAAKAAEAANTVAAFPARLTDAGAKAAAAQAAAALKAAAAGDASQLAQADTQLQAAVDSQYMAVFQKRLDIGETASKGHDMIVLALAPTVMLSAVVALLLSRSILAALKQARLVVRRISEDDEDEDVRVEGAGEFAGLMREILAMRDTVHARQRESHARELEKQAELDRLAREQQQREADNARRLAAQQAEIVAELARGMASLAAGRFDVRIATEFPGEFDRIRGDFNAAVAKLGEVVSAVSQASRSVGGGSHHIAQATRELAERTDDQASRLKETAAALADVTDTVRKSAAGARQAAEVVVQARGEADQSETVLEEAIRAMGEIEGSSSQISQIIGVIDEIAFQTNLLALNAGIEAARAGDAGRGFAVVAAEVRALAQRCAEAAHEVKGLISASQQRVELGADLVGRTGAALRRIIDKVGEIDALVAGIATSAKDQAANLEQVNGALDHMKGAIQQNAAMAQETKVAVLGLDSDAESLAGLIERFGEGAEPQATAKVA